MFLRVGRKWLEGKGVYVPDPARNSIFRYCCVLSLSTKNVGEFFCLSIGAELGSRVKDRKTSRKVCVHHRNRN